MSLQLLSPTQQGVHINDDHTHFCKYFQFWQCGLAIISMHSGQFSLNYLQLCSSHRIFRHLLHLTSAQKFLA